MIFNDVEQMIRYLDLKAIEHGREVYEITLDHIVKSIEPVGE